LKQKNRPLLNCAHNPKVEVQILPHNPVGGFVSAIFGGFVGNERRPHSFRGNAGLSIVKHVVRAATAVFDMKRKRHAVIVSNFSDELGK
jgi:hypothetical protein